MYGLPPLTVIGRRNSHVYVPIGDVNGVWVDPARIYVPAGVGEYADRQVARASAGDGPCSDQRHAYPCRVLSPQEGG